jgi:hypothetical protein
LNADLAAFQEGIAFAPVIEMSAQFGIHDVADHERPAACRVLNGFGGCIVKLVVRKKDVRRTLVSIAVIIDPEYPQ